MGNPPVHRARKRFGQHFLHDRDTCAKIVRAIAIREGDQLLEIGPGRGALTFPLLAQCKTLIAVELDRDLIPLLKRDAKKYGHLTIIQANILQFDLNDLGTEKPYRIVGNLPYNISTPLMFHLLDSVHRIQDLHCMVQEEVAQRIVAKVGSRHYGRLSVMMQYQCECQYLFGVAPACFTPAPKVNSAVIRLVPHARPAFAVGDRLLFAKIVQTAFGQRRKTIANALKKLLTVDLYADCGIDKSLRAENLTGADFARLTQAALRQSIHG